MKKYIPFLFLLIGCADHDTFFAVPHHRYKSVVTLHVIEKGAHKSNERSPSLIAGDGVRFNFNFQEVCAPKDSAIQKLYGLSDSFSNHLKWSPRIGFRTRQDSTSDVFAFAHMDVDTVEISVNNGVRFKKATKNGFVDVWMGNVHLNDFRYGAVEIERDFYEFRFDDKVVRIYGRTKSWLRGLKYRLFPYYDDGEGGGAPARSAIAIEEL